MDHFTRRNGLANGRFHELPRKWRATPPPMSWPHPWPLARVEPRFRHEALGAVGSAARSPSTATPARPWLVELWLLRRLRMPPTSSAGLASLELPDDRVQRHLHHPRTSTKAALLREGAQACRRGTGNEAWLWIESRQNAGIYSSALNSSLFTGALIHYQDSTRAERATCSTSPRRPTRSANSALQLGQTWTDPYSNVSITVTA